MSCSKPLPPFVCDLLYYLNRDQLERFSIICRPLKNFIERYFHSKPHRVFDQLYSRGGSYVLINNWVQWHHNREDYSVQQFLASQRCRIDDGYHATYYSFNEMLPYLGPTVRIKLLIICVAGNSTYNPEHITEMESISYLWRDGNIELRNANRYGGLIVAKNFQLILNSPTILQCRELKLFNARFPFKDYKVLYTVKVLEILHDVVDEIDLWYQYWQEFIVQPGVKPVVFFCHINGEYINNLLDRLSKAFSSAVSPNTFKIIFANVKKPLTEFQKTNNISGEIFELKKGPTEFRNKVLRNSYTYTLERSGI